ncbi:MAG TPA: GIY-YIG nuclease family protein [Rhizomicrobium sp.]|nr:GIY-YIG nuclease family protein [Rhizomicrobium sp.]
MSGWTYMLRCADDSCYVGSTSHEDVGVRVAEHNDAKFVGYTSRRRPVSLVWSIFFEDLRDAHETERRIEGWSRRKKEALIAGDAQKLVSSSARRGGAPLDSGSHARPLRALSWEAQATGAITPFPGSAMRSAVRQKRTAEEAQAAQKQRPLIAPEPRHPEVRAKRAPKDD